MSRADSPAEPERLKAEIAQTRTELGETVEALAAKTDIAARAKHAARQATGQAANQAKEKLTVARDQVVQVAGAVAVSINSAVASARRSVGQADVSTAVRRPPTLAAVAAIAALIGLLIYAIRRRRS